MTVDEIATLFKRSRRTIMRWVDDGKLPAPIAELPLSWDRKDIRIAHRRIRDEERHRDGRPSRKAR
jgi:predicted site-specific integrase-resolvase